MCTVHHRGASSRSSRERRTARAAAAARGLAPPPADAAGAMPRYFCDYCDVYLTHDSAPGRKQHIRGWKHRENVKQYYEQFMKQFYEQNAGLPGMSGPMMAGMPRHLICAVTKRRDAFSFRGDTPERFSEILANFESGLTSGWLPHRHLMMLSGGRMMGAPLALPGMMPPRPGMIGMPGAPPALMGGARPPLALMGAPPPMGSIPPPPMPPGGFPPMPPGFPPRGIPPPPGSIPRPPGMAIPMAPAGMAPPPPGQ